MLTSAFDEFQKNQSATVKGELVTAQAFLSAAKDGIAARDWGAGEQVFAYAKVTPAANFNPTTSATFDVGAADDKDGTNFTVLATATVLVAKLVAGSFINIGFLKSGVLKRFLLGRVTPNGGNATTGAIIMGTTMKDSGQQSFGDTANSL